MLIDSKSENRGTELERTKWITDLTECLRTYDILGLWRDAEDIIRREAVRGFVKKVTIFLLTASSLLNYSNRLYILGL